MRMNDFKYKLLEVINASGLTIEEVYYIWKDIFEDLTTNYNNILMQEEKKIDNKEENKE